MNSANVSLITLKAFCKNQFTFFIEFTHICLLKMKRFRLILTFNFNEIERSSLLLVSSVRLKQIATGVTIKIHI